MCLCAALTRPHSEIASSRIALFTTCSIQLSHMWEDAYRSKAGMVEYCQIPHPFFTNTMADCGANCNTSCVLQPFRADLEVPVTNLTNAFLLAMSQVSSMDHKHCRVIELVDTPLVSPSSSSSTTLNASCTLKSVVSSAVQPQMAAARAGPCRQQSCSTCMATNQPTCCSQMSSDQGCAIRPFLNLPLRMCETTNTGHCAGCHNNAAAGSGLV